MIFDEEFNKLTGGSTVRLSRMSTARSAKSNDDLEGTDALDLRDSDYYNDSDETEDLIDNPPQNDKTENTESNDLDAIPASKDKWYAGTDNSGSDYVIDLELKTPDIRPVPNVSDKPIAVVVDDDFETVDLMKIYLQRDYEYVSFTNAKDAIFYMNQHNPSIIFLDIRIPGMKISTFADIVRSTQGNKDVPFIYVGSDFEFSLLELNYFPEYVIGKLERPIARGKLQEVLDLI